MDEGVKQAIQKCSDTKRQKNTEPAKSSNKVTTSNPSRTKGVTPKAKNPMSKKEKRCNSDTKHGSIAINSSQQKTNNKNNNPNITGPGRRLTDRE